MRLLLGAAALLLTFSCNDKKPCRINSDCPEVERCVANTCVVLCRVDRDCGALETCARGECRLPSGEGGGAGTGGGSTAGGMSAGGATNGGTAGGAGGGATSGGTAGGTAGGATSGGSAGGGAGGAAGGSSGGTSGGSSGGDAGGAAGGTSGGSAGGSADAGTGTKRTGEPCMRGSECLTNLCFGNPTNGVAFCVDPCVTDATCQPAEMCLQVPNGMGGMTGLCVASDTGTPCATGQPTMCIASICLVHPAGVSQSVCTSPCTTARACPAGTACSLTQIGATAQKVCTPVGETCSSAGASTQCMSRWCSASQTQPSMGLCTGQCSTAADCPPGTGCDALLERCLPIGNSCTVNASMQNSCVSGTCLQGAPQGDYCTVFCSGASGLPTPARCPSGWSCINEGTAGNPAWVCER